MTKPSAEAKIAILFVTIGALVLVWSGVWYAYQFNHAPDTPASERYICYGSILSGAVLLVIGLALGRIARSARQAEMPPHEAADRPPTLAPTGLRGAVVAGNGAPADVIPAAPEAAKPAAPVARVVPANPESPSNNAAPTASF
jgi:hypothetical protein